MFRVLVLRILLALALLGPATAAAQVAAAPTVVTGPAQPVGTTTATLTGTVDPNRTETSYRFEYGTTTDYGLATPPQSAGAGDADVAVQATVDKLTANTTYHVRLVAGGVSGTDQTFKTLSAPLNPAAPRISRLSARDKTATSARLVARIDPNRAATSYHVEWGTSTSLGNRTLDEAIPSGDGDVAVSVPLTGLSPHTRIHWRVVATNAAGIKRSGTANFTTPRALTGVALTVFPATTDWSGTVSVAGQVQGAGVNGITVALEQTSFPFDGPFHEVATARTGSTGAFRFPARPVYLATRYRAVTRTASAATSPEIAAQVRARAGLHRGHKTRRSQRLLGRAHPGLPSGSATLQRRTPRGAWVGVRAKALATPSATVSTYGFTVRRGRRAAAYRVRVDPRDGGAHLPGGSRSVTVAKRR